MLDSDIVNAQNKKQFDLKEGQLFVNMNERVRTLHIAYCRSCQYSTYAFKYIPFSSLQEVEEYEKSHKDATPFKRCGNCFGKRS